MTALPARVRQFGGERAVSISEYEFLPAALEIIETPLSPVHVRMILTLCGLTAAVMVWAWFGRIDMIATAQGKVQVVGQTKTIQPLEPGKVAALSARNGQVVKRGEILMSLDATEARADVAVLESAVAAKRAEAGRRRAFVALASSGLYHASTLPASGAAASRGVVERENSILLTDLAQLATAVASLEARKRQNTAEHERLEATIASEERLVTTLRQRVDIRTELQRLDATSRSTVMDATETLQGQETYLASLTGQLGEVEAGFGATQREIDKLLAETIAENTRAAAEAERQSDEDLQKLGKAQARLEEKTLRSPIDGVIQGVAITTIGQVVSPGEQLMQVVPTETSLEIEAYLSNSDSGFVTEGQEVMVKVDSFPFTTYGALQGVVTHMAGDAIPRAEASARESNPIYSGGPTTFGGSQRTQDLVYPISIQLQPATRDRVRLKPGMTVTVEIKTGRRRILSFLFSPIVETTTSAMHER